MCCCGHGVTAMASAATTPPALQLRPPRLSTVSPSSLLLPARIPHNSAARCSWSRISAAPREHVASREDEDQGVTAVRDAPANGAVNGAANGNSKPLRPQLVEEFLFTQDYLESLDYDAFRIGVAAVEEEHREERSTAKVAVTALDPRSGSKKRLRLNSVKRDVRKALPATVAEVLPFKPESGMKFYTDLYAALLRAGRIKDCLVLLGEMDKAGKLSLMKVNHLKFYEACKTRGSVEDALAFVKIMRIYSTLKHYTMLLGVCCYFKDVDAGLRVLALLESRGFKADCMFYTTLISACAKSGKVDLLFQIFHEMELHGVGANVHTFGAMIDGCARAGHLPKAFGAYGIMIAKKVKPDRVIFNTLINACSRAGSVQRAFDVLADMKSEATPVKPDHVTYGSLISGCARGGEVDRALEVYRSMREDNVKGSPSCYTAAVHACSQKGDLDYALSIYEDVKTDGVKPDEVFFSALVDVAGHSKDIDKAFRILDNMKKSGIKPGAVVYSALMGVCSNLGDWKKALELYKGIRSSRVKPTVSTFNALMTALCEASQLDQALSVLKDLRKIGTPNQIAYAILLKGCEKAGKVDMALDLFMNARAEGIKPNVTICDSIIGLCLQQIQSSAAAPQVSMTMLRPADSSNIPPRDQWLTWALAIYRQTIGAGALPTIETLSLLLGCLRKEEVPAPTATSFDDRSLTFFGHPPASSPPPPPTPAVSLEGFDGFGIYDPRALSLFEEASTLKIAPTFDYISLQPIVINAESMPAFAAEVCLLTVMKGVKQRHAAGARVPAVTIKLHVDRKETYRPKGGMISMTVADKTGQAVAAVLRRLHLKPQGYPSRGELRLTVVEIQKWLNWKPHTSPSATKTPFAAPEKGHSHFPMLARNIADQQRAIRMGTLTRTPQPLDMFGDMDMMRQGHLDQEEDFMGLYAPKRSRRRSSSF